MTITQLFPDSDRELETRIELAMLRWQTATTPNARREHFEEFRRLKSLRSPEQIAKLERERGLRT